MPRHAPLWKALMGTVGASLAVGGAPAFGDPNPAPLGSGPLPEVLVTESGGFVLAAPDRPRLAIYADGRVIRRSGEGRLEQGSVAPAAVQAILAANRGALAAAPPGEEQCGVPDLSTATITVRDPLDVTRGVRFYGLGACTPTAPAARLFRALTRLRLTDPQPYRGPLAAYVRLADAAPGGATAWHGRRLVPSSWVRVKKGGSALVGFAGHRFALLPRMLLPHEQAGRGPGDPVVRLVTRRLGPPLAPVVRAPSTLVRGDGSWFAELADGTWQTGTLEPAQLDSFDSQLAGSGYFLLGDSYGVPGGTSETRFDLAWNQRKTVRVRDLAAGVAGGRYPVELQAATAAFQGLRPAEVTTLEPEAVRLVWRRRRRPTPITAPALPSALRLAGRPSGELDLVGRQARVLWQAMGSRSWQGAARHGRRGYQVAVEPLVDPSQ